MQFKIRKLQEKYKDDKQQLQKETQELYQREGYNPMSSGCSWHMIFPFLIVFGLIAAIYRPLQYTVRLPEEVLATLKDAATKILGEGIVGKTGANNSFVELRIIEHIGQFKTIIGSGIGQIAQSYYDKIADFAADFTLFGLNLGQTPKEGYAMGAGGHWGYYCVPIAAGVSSMLSALVTTIRTKKQNPEQKNAAMMGCSLLMGPAMQIWFSFTFPVGIGFYWITSSLVMFIQTLVLGWTHPPQKMMAKLLVEETIQRRAREKNRKQIVENL
jgi:YidC/Oxa1 family membrane protein insertase